MAILALAVLGLSLGQAAVAADEAEGLGINLLTNPNFDDDSTGWGYYWDGAHDAGGNPQSGSLQIILTSTEALSTNAFQCVPITPGAYELRGKVFTPTGIYPTGSYADLGVVFDTGASCNVGGNLPQFFTQTLLLATTQNSWVSLGTGPVIAPAGTQSAWIVPRIKTPSAGTITANFDDLLFAAVVGNCVATSTTLCIDDTPGDHRFAIVVSFTTSQAGGLSGAGKAIPLASLSVNRGGLFSFFDADNPEMLIKVLNACSLNEKYWVFFAAVTNVGFTVTVTDTITGQQKMYHNQDLHAASPVQDTSALPCN